MTERTKLQELWINTERITVDEATAVVAVGRDTIYRMFDERPAVAESRQREEVRGRVRRRSRPGHEPEHVPPEAVDEQQRSNRWPVLRLDADWFLPEEPLGVTLLAEVVADLAARQRARSGNKVIQDFGSWSAIVAQYRSQGRPASMRPIPQLSMSALEQVIRRGRRKYFSRLKEWKARKRDYAINARGLADYAGLSWTSSTSSHWRPWWRSARTSESITRGKSFWPRWKQGMRAKLPTR